MTDGPPLPRKRVGVPPAAPRRGGVPPPHRAARPPQAGGAPTASSAGVICPDVEVVSDAAGRMRVRVPWVRANSRRAVAVEEAVDRQHGVRAVHAYPHTG